MSPGEEKSYSPETEELMKNFMNEIIYKPVEKKIKQHNNSLKNDVEQIVTEMSRNIEEKFEDIEENIDNVTEQNKELNKKFNTQEKQIVAVEKKVINSCDEIKMLNHSNKSILKNLNALRNISARQNKKTSCLGTEIDKLKVSINFIKEKQTISEDLLLKMTYYVIFIQVLSLIAIITLFIIQ